MTPFASIKRFMIVETDMRKQRVSGEAWKVLQKQKAQTKLDEAAAAEAAIDAKIRRNIELYGP
jgi:hypothetical protein